MKTLALLFLIVTPSVSHAYSIDPSAYDRLYRIEVLLQELISKVDYLTQRIDKEAEYKANNTFQIVKIDDFFQTISLSNGLKFSYSHLDVDLNHWLVGHAVRLERAQEYGCVRIVNISTGDWIEAKKTNF